MIGPRSNFWGTLWTLVLFFVIERLAKPIWDVEVQDLWKDSAHPAIRDQLWPWVRTLLEWTGPYWAGVISAVSLMLVVEIVFARLRSAKQNVAPPAITDDLTDRIPLESSASQVAIPPKALPSVRRLAKRADSMELAAIVQTENRVYVLSNWQPEGADFERIRVDALLKNGFSDAYFVLEKSGFISFNFTRSIKSNAQRIVSLADGTLLLAGSSFNEEMQMSSAFLAKIDTLGSLVTNFGTGGVLVLPRENTQACAHDAAEAGGFIYCIVSNNQSADITVLQMTSAGELVDEHRVPVAKSGIVWPSRIVRTFPDNGFLIAGKISTADSASTDGFVVKIDANISIDKYYGHEGVVLLGETFSLPSVHQLINLIVFPTGNVLVAGTGNEGFVVALSVCPGSFYGFT